MLSPFSSYPCASVSIRGSLIKHAAARTIGICGTAESIPMKLALFDCREGMIALLDPVVTRPTWTSVMFTHAGLGEAMKGLFDDRWLRAAAHAWQAEVGV